MPRPVRIVGVVVIAVVGAMLGGCERASVPPAEIRAEGYDCGFSGDAYTIAWDVTPTPGSVPDGFDPVEAVWCKPELAPGADRELVMTELRSSRVAPLVERFATPDNEGSDEVACDMVWTIDLIPPHVWLVDDEGRAILGHSPLGICVPDLVGLDKAFPQAS